MMPADCTNQYEIALALGRIEQKTDSNTQTLERLEKSLTDDNNTLSQRVTKLETTWQRMIGAAGVVGALISYALVWVAHKLGVSIT